MQPPKTISWKDALSIYSQPKVIALAFLGFSAGLPFLLVFSTLTAWLRDDGVSKSAIGFFAWVGITYSIKVLWAPVVDRLSLPLLTNWLGQRRGWMLIAQLGIATGLILMSYVGSASLVPLSMCALLVAFSSSTQDIAIDAFRIESADDEFQGAMSASYIFGYRVALLAAGAGALYLAEFYSWPVAYLLMSALVSVGIITVLLINEPVIDQQRFDIAAEQKIVSRLVGDPDSSRIQHASAWFIGAVVSPFVEFFQRQGKFALVILLFIAVFRLSDIAMGIMANPFYLDMGYSKAEIASVAKVFGFFMSIAGSALCGILIIKWGIMKPLLVGAIAVAGTNLFFAGLSLLEPRLEYLAFVISADNISGGFAATAFIAYLSSLTNQAYTATQYALFSSLMTLPGKFISGFSGLVVDGYGYFPFFVIAAAIGIPAVVLVIVLMQRQARDLAALDSDPKDPSHSV